MNYWLVKTEPSTYSWDDLVKKGEEVWDGVRNFQARNFLQKMNLGDLVFVYHSGKQKEIVGIAEISQEAFPDQGAKETEGWVAVKIKPKKTLPKPLSLKTIKSESTLSEILLVKQPRLSVMPIPEIAAEQIIKMSQV